MTIEKNNYWIVISLLITAIIGPIVTRKFQQGEIESLKLTAELDKIQLEKNKQSKEMYEDLSTKLNRYRILYAELIKISDSSDDGCESNRLEYDEKKYAIEGIKQEIENLKAVISRLTGKNIDYIKDGGISLPMRPTCFHAVPLPE